jgi:hypothetical protein
MLRLYIKWFCLFLLKCYREDARKIAWATRSNLYSYYHHCPYLLPASSTRATVHKMLHMVQVCLWGGGTVEHIWEETLTGPCLPLSDLAIVPYLHHFTPDFRTELPLITARNTTNFKFIFWEKVRSKRINLEGNTHAQEINVSQLPV